MREWPTALPAEIEIGTEDAEQDEAGGQRFLLTPTGARPGPVFIGGSAAWQRGAEFEQRFAAVFNFATISWYTWSPNPEPPEQRIDYARMDQSLEWCRARRIGPKGFGYVYLANGTTPEWLRQWPYEKVLPEYKRIVAQTLRHPCMVQIRTPRAKMLTSQVV